MKVLSPSPSPSLTSPSPSPSPGIVEAESQIPHLPATLLCAKEFGSNGDGLLRLHARNLRPSSCLKSITIPSLFVAAGLLFGRRQFVIDVPYDKEMVNVFFGEETMLSLRAFTHGYRFYCPTQVVALHLWSRQHRPSFRSIEISKQTEQLAELAMVQMRALFEGNLQVGGVHRHHHRHRHRHRRCYTIVNGCRYIKAICFGLTAFRGRLLQVFRRESSRSNHF